VLSLTMRRTLQTYWPQSSVTTSRTL